MKDSHSFYDILGISKTASDADIKRAYLALAKKYHPDRDLQNRKTAIKRFQMITEAYRSLETREKRASYNQKLRHLNAQNDNTKNQGFLKTIENWFRPQETQK